MITAAAFYTKRHKIAPIGGLFLFLWVYLPSTRQNAAGGKRKCRCLQLAAAGCMFGHVVKMLYLCNILNAIAAALTGCCETAILPLYGGGTGNGHTATIAAEDTQAGACFYS